nr:glycerol kinase-like [Onthophagus taurus]
MNKDYGAKLKNLQVDGGMTTNSMLMQLQADLTGVTIGKPKMAESTALGAAMCAGAAMGCWNVLPPMDIPLQAWPPKLKENERDVRYARWKDAVERSFGWDN